MINWLASLSRICRRANTTRSCSAARSISGRVSACFASSRWRHRRGRPRQPRRQRRRRRAPKTVAEHQPLEPNGGVDIDVYKIIDADGNLDTFDDQTAGEGWEFKLELTDGTVEDLFVVTDADGFGGWTFTFGPDGTSATVTEFEQLGDPEDPVFREFELLDASCYEKFSLTRRMKSWSVSSRGAASASRSRTKPTTAANSSILRRRRLGERSRSLSASTPTATSRRPMITPIPPGWKFEVELADGTVEPFNPVTASSALPNLTLSSAPTARRLP